MTFHLDTRVARAPLAGHASRPIGTPIVQSATFEAADVETQLGLQRGDRFYTRYGNPTHSVAEAALAELEGAEGALVFASGMAATATTLLALVRPGDHLVAQRDLYGGTYEFMRDWLPRAGVDVTLVGGTDVEGFADAIRPTTRLVFVESPSNPLLRIVDLAAIASLARTHGLVSVIDNTFASPINQRPHTFGFDVVVHSATKYLAGHSDLVAGAVTGARAVIGGIAAARTVLGGVMDPHASWLLIRGLRTLAVRVARQNLNALWVAEFLERHPRVQEVHYPFLSTHPQHALARAQMQGGGGVVSFEIDGPDSDAVRLVEALHIFALAGSLGGVESLVTIPALTTHAMLPPDEQRAMGISPRLIRLAVGIEHPDDLVADLGQAIDRLSPAVRAGRTGSGAA